MFRTQMKARVLQFFFRRQEIAAPPEAWLHLGADLSWKLEIIKIKQAAASSCFATPGKYLLDQNRWNSPQNVG